MQIRELGTAANPFTECGQHVLANHPMLKAKPKFGQIGTQLQTDGESRQHFASDSTALEIPAHIQVDCLDTLSFTQFGCHQAQTEVRCPTSGGKPTRLTRGTQGRQGSLPICRTGHVLLWRRVGQRFLQPFIYRLGDLFVSENSDITVDVAVTLERDQVGNGSCSLVPDFVSVKK